jgi:DNA-binding CsgD family transcriptional regulator
MMARSSARRWRGWGRCAGASAPSAEARRLPAEALPLLDAAGDRWSAAWARSTLGHVAFNADELAEARPLLEAGARAFEELGDSRHIGFGCVILGTVLARLGERDRASDLLRRGLAHWQDVGERVYLFGCLRDLASVALLWGQPVRAARLLGAAQPLGEAMGTTLAPVNRAMEDRLLVALRSSLTEAELAAALAAGRAMRREAVLAEALAAVQPGDRASRSRPVTAMRPAAGGLTPREREVAGCLAQGCSDRQIAARLGIAPRTAGVHVRNLLAKLEVRSRWQVRDRLLGRDLDGPALAEQAASSPSCTSST